MYTLIDRANGEILTALDEANFQVLKTHLVQESSEDFDFYLNEATLDFLREQGLTDSLFAALEEQVKGRGLDMGWESTREGTNSLHTGQVVDNEGQPLGGIRVDLLDLTPLVSGRLEKGRTILDWAYTRKDGTFALGHDPDDPGTQLRFSGRGDLVLQNSEVTTAGDQGTFEIQTLTGTLQTEDGEPLKGASVQLLNWSLAEGGLDEDVTLGGSLSWGDSDETGRFAIPLHVPTDQGEVNLRLEVLGISGESLFEDLASFDPAQGFEIGKVITRAPQEDFGLAESPPDLRQNAPRSFEHPLS